MKPIRLVLFAGGCFCAALLPAQTARLINISTNGPVGTGANYMVGGFVIGGTGKTVLIRAIGPGLAAFGVGGTLPNPLLTLFDSSSNVIATNSKWNSADAATMASVGAFPLPPGSNDAAIVTTLQPGAYTAQISGLGSVPTGTAILEVYDVSGGGQLINIATRLNVGAGPNGAAAGFVVSPGAGTRKLLIRGIGPALAAFGLPGTLPDPKIALLDGNQNVLGTALANGGSAAIVSAMSQAGAFTPTANDSVIIATVAPGSYTVQLSGNSGTTSGIALVEVYDITSSAGTPIGFSMSPQLYYTNLRPAAGATGSIASGYATILFDPNTASGMVNVSFSNLTSAEVVGHLVLGASGGNGAFVQGLPPGQVSGTYWAFNATGPYSSNDLVAALLTGNISVEIDSANFPGGELVGGLVRTTGSQIFTASAAPPALATSALTAPTQTDAARFLTQATFGPTMTDINLVTSEGITKWINDQMALPATSALAGLRADVAAFPDPPNPNLVTAQVYEQHENWDAAWWKIAATAPDQLRQRVAFALSEIFVVGTMAQIDHEIESKVKYYDILVNDAFGNYRQLLEDVTLNPAMGNWLSLLNNQKADPTKGTSPDENYAREVQQLFSIGLVQLQPDGSLMLDATGQPIPTYNQTTITETAKVFTGWSYATSSFGTLPPSTAENPVHNDSNAWLNPMAYFDAFHDKTQKNVVSLQQVPLAQSQPTVLPANQTGPQDLKMMLDTLFNHPNTGPFICKQLIQRLVTSNPSSSYVYRVAQVFTNDGTGARGNLGAVVKAILTDYEARSPSVLANIGYGKIKEPMIRLTAFYRALNASAPNGRYLDSYFLDPRAGGYYPYGPLQAGLPFFGEEPLWSLTVFNFFSPFYAPPGPIAAAGLVAPEMQITDEYSATVDPNLIVYFMYRDISTFPQPPAAASPFIVPDYSGFLPLAKNTTALVSQVNLIFCANQMTAATQGQLVSTLQALPSAVTDIERVQTAVHLAIVSPDGAVQK